MEPLKLLSTERDYLRGALLDGTDDEYGFDLYEHDAYNDDGLICAAVRRLDDWLRANPVNGGDTVDITLVGEPDGVIAGYEFQYGTRTGDHALSLASNFREWKDLYGDNDGIEGVVDLLLSVIHSLNWTIHEANGWMAARAAA